MKLLARDRRSAPEAPVKYPGIRTALDGSAAVVAVETAASEAAASYPIAPSARMHDGWAAAAARGQANASGRRLLFVAPESEQAAAAVAAGMSMTGLRTTSFASGQGLAQMHESLYASVGKRLTFVLHVAARAMTKHAVSVHAAHDDYHAVDDTGLFQVFAADVQEAADLALVAHRIAELSLNPGIAAQDGLLTSDGLETLWLPEPALVREYLGDPADAIESPTPSQRLVFGEKRRRIPELFDLDYPAMLGTVQHQDGYAQGVAAQRPFYFDHVAELADRAFAEFAALTGRRYARASGYRLDDAEYVIAGQGSMIAGAHAAADHLRARRGVKVGVLNLTMFRPFPADLVTALLAGKTAVAVLERTDQPLASDAPLLREIRAAVSKAAENGRATRGRTRGTPALPYPGLPAIAPDAVPGFFSGCFGLGGRELQRGDIIAAVEHMLAGGGGRRQFYLGVDFVRKGTRLPKLQIWQEQLVDAYPDVATLALPRADDAADLPQGALPFRVHSIGGWGVAGLGRTLATTVSALFGLHVKASPEAAPGKNGAPTTFHGVLAPERVRGNGASPHAAVVLSPDPNVFRHSDPLAGLTPGGVLVVQAGSDARDLWATVPANGRRTLLEGGVRVYGLDALAIAREEAAGPELRQRLQRNAFLGAFLATAPLGARRGQSEEELFAGVERLLAQDAERPDAATVETEMRAVRRGFAEARLLDLTGLPAAEPQSGTVPAMPLLMKVPAQATGVGQPGRFWEQVCFLCSERQDGLADPFAAIGAMPAVSSAVRDMTAMRLEVPRFVAERCTGCAQCWIQCPDSAIPGLVNSVDELLETAIAAAAESRPVDRLKQVAKHLARECRARVGAESYTSFAATVEEAYRAVTSKLGWDADRRAELDAQFAPVHAALAAFGVARTRPFFDVPESQEKGTGGLLSVTINPEACKGCNLCVEVCPDGALVTVRQTDEVVESLRRDWDFWRKLPDTADRYVEAAKLDPVVGTASSLLLKKSNYLSMVGGDGACAGCGEKTVVHLVVSAIHATMQPRVAGFVAKLDTLIGGLDAKARELLAADADIDRAAHMPAGHVEVAVSPANRERLERITARLKQLTDLKWRYTAGPGGRGRASLGMANSTDCSSSWAATYPYNPYPFPWTSHLVQDAPSIATGLFEGHMRKMADGFLEVRRAELELAGEYDPEASEAALAGFDWRRFTDEEFFLCPPIVAVGGDSAMLESGFQGLSHVLASGKPVRVVVLDTQGYAHNGGRGAADTAMAPGAGAPANGHHGVTAPRKDLALIALAHRGAFVHQSSQASASHLVTGVVKGLQARRPAVFNLYTPCPVEHGLAPEWSQRAARLALESRAVPNLTFDPDAGASFAECLALDGNPAADRVWPTYTLGYETDDGAEAKMELPLTIADWAATEGRFRTHFAVAPLADWNDDMVPFHEFLDLDPDAREGKVPFIYTLDGRKLGRLLPSAAIVALADERRLFWSQLRELAGLEIPAVTRDRVVASLEQDYERRLAAMQAEHAKGLADLQANYTYQVAHRLAAGLLRVAEGRTVGDLVTAALAAPYTPLPVPALAAATMTMGATAPDGAAPAVQEAPGAAMIEAPVAAATPAAAPASAMADLKAGATPDEPMAMEPYIDTALCTSCNECTNISKKLFAYDGNKQAYVKDPRGGTFQQLVRAAEQCPVKIIHPGTPLDPTEKDLDKWVARAAPFN